VDSFHVFSHHYASLGVPVVVLLWGLADYQPMERRGEHPASKDDWIGDREKPGAEEGTTWSWSTMVQPNAPAEMMLIGSNRSFPSVVCGTIFPISFSRPAAWLSMCNNPLNIDIARLDRFLKQHYGTFNARA
jgi:hypothetical protein